MKTINVIEVVDNNVIGMTSFLDVYAPGNDNVEKAEKLFTKLAKENGAKKSDINEFLENGAYSENGYTVNLVWSDILE